MFNLLAQVISIIFSPPVFLTWAFGVMLLQSESSNEQKIWQFTLFIFSELAIIAFVIWLWRKKYISDLSISIREERHRTNFAMIIYLVFACTLSAVGHLPQLYAISFYMLIGVVSFSFLTLITKVSAHMAAAVAWALLFTRYSGFEWWVVVIVLLTGWARIKRKRHTLTQVFLGTVLSVGTYFLVMYTHLFN